MFENVVLQLTTAQFHSLSTQLTTKTTTARPVLKMIR